MLYKPVNRKPDVENIIDFTDRAKRSSLLMKSVEGTKSVASTQKRIKMLCWRDLKISRKGTK